MNFGTVAVLGAGQMGSGIAQLCARCGLSVFLQDNNPAQSAVAVPAIQKSLIRAAERGDCTTADVDSAIAKISTHTAIDSYLADADIVIEAVSEDLSLKQKLYAEIESQMRSDAILATNTSSFSIGELAKHLQRPQQFIGVHFMNPAPRMVLVEIIPSAQTDSAIITAAENFAKSLGKETVRSADRPGFLTNRILMPLINEAIWALHDKTGAVEDIDRAMSLGMNHPMGPLTLADFIGLDTCLAVLHTLHTGFNDDKFTPCPLLVQMVQQKKLGRKSGHGFYEYKKS